MMRRGSVASLLGCLLLALPAAAKDCPFAAHNAYPYLFWGGDSFERALAAGLKHIEVDITYDPARQAACVTHDSRPKGKEPLLHGFLEPLWRTWEAADDGGYTLILDCKSSEPGLARSIAAILKGREPLLSCLSLNADGSDGRFTPGKITVCLTGSGEAHRQYRAVATDRGRLFAFGDAGSEEWKSDPAAYVPADPAGFIRFLTFERRAFLSGPDKTKSADVSLERLRAVVELANQRGYRIRIYTCNAKKLIGIDDSYWRACVAAGVHMIATDDYELARDWWRRNSR